MVRTTRSALVVLVVALLGFVLAPASGAAAATSLTPSAAATGCGESQDGYPAPCLMSVRVAPVCVENVPEVSYAVLGTPPNVTTVNVTFVNPSGTSAVLSNLPLSGQFASPAAFVKAGILIRFAAGPQAQATAVYPTATEVCGPTVTPTPTPQVLVDTPSPTPTPTVTPVSQVLAADDPAPTSAVLSSTGATDAPLLVAAIAFIAIGAAAVTLVTIARRRRNA